AGNNFDIGLFGTGGLAEGWQQGTAAQVGVVKGNEDDIRGITVNVNVAAAVGSGTVMLDTNGNVVGGALGPAAEGGASVTLSKTQAVGLGDLGTWLGGRIYEYFHPYPGPSAKGACP